MPDQRQYIKPMAGVGDTQQQTMGQFVGGKPPTKPMYNPAKSQKEIDTFLKGIQQQQKPIQSSIDVQSIDDLRSARAKMDEGRNKRLELFDQGHEMGLMGREEIMEPPGEDDADKVSELWKDESRLLDAKRAQIETTKFLMDIAQDLRNEGKDAEVIREQVFLAAADALSREEHLTFAERKFILLEIHDNLGWLTKPMKKK